MSLMIKAIVGFIFHFVVFLTICRQNVYSVHNSSNNTSHLQHKKTLHGTRSRLNMVNSKHIKDSSHPSSTKRRTNSDIEIHPKLGGMLTHLVHEYTKTGARTLRSVNHRGGVRMLQDDLVLVDMVGDNMVKSLSESLSNDGFPTINCHKHICSMYVPVDKLHDLAKLDYVHFLRPALATTHQSNGRPTISEGDRALQTDVVRSRFNVSGAGILIGVLSDSFNCLQGADDDIQNGDLPSLANIVIVSDLNATECVAFNGTDEGRKMMQILYDVSPGARLAFRTAVRGEADFASGIKELANIGCDIIVDDVSYSSEPFFQDGIITKAVDDIVTAGVIYFSAIGNQGSNAWNAPNGFVSSGISDAGGVYHKFGADSNGNPITFQLIKIPIKEGNIRFVINWSEPYKSAIDSGSVAGSTSDINVLFSVDDTIIGRGEDNNLNMDPIEIVEINPLSLDDDDDDDDDDVDFLSINMTIQLKTGPPPLNLRVIAFNEGTADTTFEYGVPGTSSSFGHSNSALGAGVGAANYSQTPAYGVSPPIAESYSSFGGTPILFDDRGVRLLSPEVRNQPRFIGPDGTSTTATFNQRSRNLRFKPPRKRFSGTSAAAPHVAGTSALLLEGAGGPGKLPPSNMYQILQNSAIDMDNNATLGFDVGFDFKTGFGFINAVNAFPAARAASNSTIPTASPTSTACGLFGLSLFCPFDGCGFIKRTFGLFGC